MLNLFGANRYPSFESSSHRYPSFETRDGNTVVANRYPSFETRDGSITNGLQIRWCEMVNFFLLLLNI